MSEPNSESPPSILLVEDDPSLVHAIGRNLTVRGYAMESAATVEEALAALNRGLPAMLLLDIDLPDGSGWQVLRELRARGGQAVPVLVLSALRPNPKLADELKCAAVLEKPFPMEALMRLVSESLERSSEASVS